MPTSWKISCSATRTCSLRQPTFRRSVPGATRSDCCLAHRWWLSGRTVTHMAKRRSWNGNAMICYIKGSFSPAPRRTLLLSCWGDGTWHLCVDYRALNNALLTAVSESSDLSRRRPLHRGLPTAPSHRALLLLAGVAVVFVPPILLSADDQLGAVARLHGAAGVAAPADSPVVYFPQGHSEQVSFFPR
jgi:hypothetical protein